MTHAQPLRRRIIMRLHSDENKSQILLGLNVFFSNFGLRLKYLDSSPLPECVI